MVLAVYQVKIDRKFRDLASDDGELVRKYGTRNCFTVLANDWTCMNFYITDPGQKKGTFYDVLGDMWATTAATVEEFKAAIKDDVEVLPVSVEGQKEQFLLWNVIRPLDAIDEVATEWELWGATRMLPKKYAFRPDALVRSMLFKVPQFPTIVFASVNSEAGSPGFVECYEKLKATGLIFNELWRA